MLKEHRRALIEGGFNVIGAATYILSCSFLILDFGTNFRISSLFMLVRRFIYALLFVTRKTPPKKTNTSPRDWLIAFCGSYLPNLIVPSPVMHDIWYFQLLQGVGFIICLLGAVALNESFGVVAANRGIKSNGIYGYVRHPIYAGYFVESVTFIAQNFTFDNIIVMIIWMAFQLRRIYVEELCLAEDPDYRAYMKKVRWRLVPFVY
jgi:protein-S-isoprenylcysteine O-methyltransferase Ste14